MTTPCVRCGLTTRCLVERCRRCLMVSVATCQRCDTETGGKVREWQRKAHEGRCSRLPKANPWAEGHDER